jgi:ABC-type phosphate transport system auxiliary subunit
MNETKKKILKEKIRQRVESYMRSNGIKFTKKKSLTEKTQGEIDAEKKEVEGRIKTKEEQIKALQAQIATLKQMQGKISSEKPDETSG